VPKRKPKGLGYPQQPCGLSYEQFRSGWRYADAYEFIAFRPESKGVSQKAVLREMGKLKRAEFERYRDECEGAAAVGLGRTYAQKRAIERSRLITVPEAQARVASKGPVPTTLPSHIKPFANWMASRQGHLPSNREVIKAYVIARSSVMRGGLPKATVCKTFPEYREIKRLAQRKNVRPEDTMATLLFTPEGKRYLDAAERGRLDQKAAKALAERTACFGFSNEMLADLEYAPGLAWKRDALQHAYRGPRTGWISFVQENVSGISAAKAGFFAALLGRGDMPTYDAREIALWRRKKPKKGSPAPEGPEVEAFVERISAYPMTLAPEHEPFREHLVHHALWEAYPVKGKRSKTTHGATIRAMQFAGVKR